MSFLRSIKKIFQKEEKSREETFSEDPKEAKAISLEELKLKIKDQGIELSARKENFLKELVSRISAFETGLEQKIQALKNVDLSKRKEDERIKRIVNESLSIYIQELISLAQNLRSVSQQDLEKHLEDSSKAMHDFRRLSNKPFEKATFLIGKELEDARRYIRVFEHDLASLADSARPTFDAESKLKRISSLMDELDKNAHFLASISQQLNHLNVDLKREKEESDKTAQSLDGIKNSLEYQNDLRLKEARKRKIEDLEREIRSIQKSIDFKLLARVYHADKKKHELISNYSLNFRSALKEDEGLEIISLVKGAQGIGIESLRDLLNKLEELSKPFVTEADQKISDLQIRINQLNLQASNIQSMIGQNYKIKEKSEAKKIEILSEINTLSVSVFGNKIQSSV